jgi:hypothetical protein
MAQVDFATSVNAESGFATKLRLLPLLLHIIASQQAWPDNIADNSNNLLVKGEIESLGNLYSQILAATNTFKCGGTEGVTGVFAVTGGLVTMKGGIIVSMDIDAIQTYVVSNVTPDRTYDADSTSLNELADVLGTLIDDLRAIGIVA